MRELENNSEHEVFLQLVRLGIGASKNVKIPKDIDWAQLKDLADSQGLAAIVLDGIDKLNTNLSNNTNTLPLEFKLEWIGETLQSESVYASQWKAACEMSQIFDANGIRTYVLKGFVVSECYPKPGHRVNVDLDCFLAKEDEGGWEHSEAWELGNQLMENAGYEVDRSFYKNSTITLPGLTVENHQFMNAVRGSKRLKNLEKYLQSWILGDSELSKFEFTSMYRPPVMLSALFLIEHAYAHFLHEGLTWRMVLDWVMYSKKHKEEIDWEELNAKIDEFGFRKFYDVFNAIGMETFNDNENDYSGLLRSQSHENYNQNHQEFKNLRMMMVNDMWAPLDLHEFHGVKGKLALAGNEIRAAWKYHYFSPDTMIGDLFNRVRGFLFERHPKI